jgi:hypothetical protein
MTVRVKVIIIEHHLPLSTTIADLNVATFA